MLLLLTVSCFSKVQISINFPVPAHPGSPGKRAVKRVCVCVTVNSYGDCVDNTVEENSSIFSLIQMRQQGYAGSKPLHQQNPANAG